MYIDGTHEKHPGLKVIIFLLHCVLSFRCPILNAPPSFLKAPQGS